MAAECYKFQITNIKYQTNPKNQIQNYKPLKNQIWVIEYWNLRFICYLEIENWNLICRYGRSLK